MTPRHRQQIVIFLTLLAAVLFFYFRTRSLGADLMAAWLAGHFLTSGQAGLVYPPDMGIFTMYAPNEWVTYLQAEYGYRGPVYPFLYPPLWAWVAGFFSQTNGFAVVNLAALAVNCALLSGSIWLAIRLTLTRLHPVLYAVLAAAGLMFTPIGMLALVQAQPQVLVSFLLLLAIERSRNGGQITAGVALALAASLKLYPALFALIWLATGQRRAFWSFLGAGLALAAASVALIGWPLHQAFLEQVAIMSSTVFVTMVSANLDAVIAQVMAADHLNFVPALNSAWRPESPSGWYVMHRPPLWSWLSSLALLAALAALAWALRRADDDRRYGALWPLLLLVSTLLSPFAWIYYYIPAAVLAPALLDRLGLRLGGAVFALGLAPILLPLFEPYKTMAFLPLVFPLAAVCAMSVWTAGFALAAFCRGKSNRMPRTPLHRPGFGL